MTEFRAARLDRPTMLVTLALIVVLIGIALTVPSAVGDPAVAAVGWGVSVATVVLAWGFAPRGYALSADGLLRIRRKLFGSKDFRITRAEPMPELFGFGGIRLVGSGGAFGWYGLFWRKGTGRYRAYVTDRGRLIACTGPTGLVVISPDDPEAFLAAAPATEAPS